MHEVLSQMMKKQQLKEIKRVLKKPGSYILKQTNQPEEKRDISEYNIKLQMPTITLPNKGQETSLSF